ncbi:MAG: rRNA pseudouridine synthase [Clostridiales bacterium]|jgi:23S rRNA pseudouridine2605 synthase|nr:rRNA pseudouridine synthase [Clostridiales bacterium]
MRINKYLAECGVASRRKCDVLISAGKVSVNGKITTALGTDVDVENDTVFVDGKRVKPVVKHVYIMLNKPKGIVCTASDDKGRKTVLDIVNIPNVRLFPVGRLDYDTEGLLILTTDGDFANHIMHPSHEVPKTYVARIAGGITESELAQLRKGVVIDGEKTKPCRARVIGEEPAESRVEIVISEGRNRQIRKMFEALQKNVVFLKRSAVGELKLGGLSRGEYRPLTAKEIDYLSL